MKPLDARDAMRRLININLFYTLEISCLLVSVKPSFTRFFTLAERDEVIVF